MFKCSHRSLIIISGLVWFVVGCFLLQLGLNLLMASAASAGGSGGLLSSLGIFVGGYEEAAIAIIAVALFIGYLKGRYVLGKSARRAIQRILSFSTPVSLANIYSGKYYLLLAAMVGLGISIKYLGIPLDIRGAIDVAIGAALINGALVYFQHRTPATEPQS